MTKNKKWLTGATLLALSSLIVKVLSAVYRIPFQNLVGNDGFYIYQQVYPIYGLGMSLTLTGVPLYVSKCIVATSDEQRRPLIQSLYTILLGLSLLIFLGLYTFSHPLAQAMGDGQLTPVIQMVSLTFLLAPFLGIWRGVYQGAHYLQPTAYSQLLEQSLRVVVILVSAFFLMQWQESLYTIGTAAMSGSVIGGVAALILLWRMKKRYPISLSHEDFRVRRVSLPVVKSFLYECTILSVSVSFMLVMQCCDSFFVTQRLADDGMMLSLCRNMKGIYDRGQPMIQVGLVLMTVLVADFLPRLTKDYQRHHSRLFDYHKKMLIHTSLFFGIATSLGLAFLMPYVNTMLFENNEGGRALSLLMLSVFLMAILLVLQTISQSQNNLSLLWKSLVLGTIVKCVMSYWLIKPYHLEGAALSTLIALLVADGFYLYCERHKLRGDGHFYFKAALVTLIYIVGLMMYNKLALPYLTGRGAAFVLGVGGVIVNGAIIVLAARALRLLTPKEWLSMPLGKYIVKVVK